MEVCQQHAHFPLIMPPTHIHTFSTTASSLHIILTNPFLCHYATLSTAPATPHSHTQSVRRFLLPLLLCFSHNFTQQINNSTWKIHPLHFTLSSPPHTHTAQNWSMYANEIPAPTFRSLFLSQFYHLTHFHLRTVMNYNKYICVVRTARNSNKRTARFPLGRACWWVRLVETVTRLVYASQDNSQKTHPLSIWSIFTLPIKL